MRVTFRMEGGTAHFPGLSRPVEIDTGELPPPEARELEEELRAARLFERPQSRLGAAVPDARTYFLVVEDGDERREHVIREPVEDSALAALLAHLRRLQRRLLATR